jgi:hypothetical protein
MFYNDGNTEVVKEKPTLYAVEYIGEAYSENNNIDYKYYIIYIVIKVKLFGITILKRDIRLKEWGQYDEV